MLVPGRCIDPKPWSRENRLEEVWEREPDELRAGYGCGGDGGGIWRFPIVCAEDVSEFATIAISTSFCKYQSDPDNDGKP